MNEILEIEFKLLLSQPIYNQIKNDYKDKIVNDYIQTNYYLTHPLLQQKQFMLRIREKNNSYELTLKRPLKGNRLETNIMIDEVTKDKIFNRQKVDNEIFDILKEENIDPLELEQQFSLTTHRIDIPLEYGVLSLDENHYLGITDYELEYEVTNEKEGYLHFLSIIKPYHLTYIMNCPGKIRRVLDKI